MSAAFRYGLRVFRMVDLFARGRINFASLKQSLRSSQVTVLAKQGGTLFCDADTERMAFGAD